MEEYKTVPITLITGYLGSGKTTLINHILKNAKGHKMAVNEYCDKVEKAIADEIIDDGDIETIKDSEKNYMNLISEITESYAGNADERAEFEQQMYSSDAWVRMADVNTQLANTEGYAKLSLTNK